MSDDSEPSSIESFPARNTELGSLKIVRALPRRQRRMVGPWCFLDRYGPLSFGPEKPMDVAPHPHIGLQTVSWLTDGEIVHHDSLGYEALMRAGQLNLMTSGRGIAHAEETPPANSGVLSGVQLWVALPPGQQRMAPIFDHYASLPTLELSGGSVTVITGQMDGVQSPARTFSPIVGADITLHSGSPCVLPLQPDFEHALFVLEGSPLAESRVLERDHLHYSGRGRSELSLSAKEHARVLLIGGAPFEKPVLMWWNFVAETHEELMDAREAWVRNERFGEVKGYQGARTPAPDMPVTSGKGRPANS